MISQDVWKISTWYHDFSKKKLKNLDLSKKFRKISILIEISRFQAKSSKNMNMSKKN